MFGFFCEFNIEKKYSKNCDFYLRYTSKHFSDEFTHKKRHTSRHVFSQNFNTDVPFKKQKLYFTHFSLGDTYLIKKSIVYIKA
jgi:hypothetical protein